MRARGLPSKGPRVRMAGNRRRRVQSSRIPGRAAVPTGSRRYSPVFQTTGPKLRQRTWGFESPLRRYPSAPPPAQRERGSPEPGPAGPGSRQSLAGKGVKGDDPADHVAGLVSAVLGGSGVARVGALGDAGFAGSVSGLVGLGQGGLGRVRRGLGPLGARCVARVRGWPCIGHRGVGRAGVARLRQAGVGSHRFSGTSRDCGVGEREPHRQEVRPLAGRLPADPFARRAS